jgi:hypothetical protein
MSKPNAIRSLASAVDYLNNGDAEGAIVAIAMTLSELSPGKNDDTIDSLVDGTAWLAGFLKDKGERGLQRGAKKLREARESLLTTEKDEAQWNKDIAELEQMYT